MVVFVRRAAVVLIPDGRAVPTSEIISGCLLPASIGLIRLLRRPYPTSRPAPG